MYIIDNMSDGVKVYITDLLDKKHHTELFLAIFIHLNKGFTNRDHII